MGIMEFLESIIITPYGFAFATFVVCIALLLKLIKEERGKNREGIEKLQAGQNNLDKKLDQILKEIAFKEVMERE